MLHCSEVDVEVCCCMKSVALFTMNVSGKCHCKQKLSWDVERCKNRTHFYISCICSSLHFCYNREHFTLPQLQQKCPFQFRLESKLRCFFKGPPSWCTDGHSLVFLLAVNDKIIVKSNQNTPVLILSKENKLILNEDCRQDKIYSRQN